MIARLKNRWQGPGGCAEVLRVAFPLVLSTSAHTIQMFVDRMFLTWHSNDTMSAAMPAGILSFTFVSFFMGTVGYVNTFVAQYTGAQRPRQVGAAIWQGIFLSIAGAALMLFLLPLAPTFFDWMGHDESVRVHEVVYFKIMCLSAAPVLISTTISGFFTGRSKTWTVLVVNTVGIVINIVLDWLLIFGNCSLPQMGIAGAGWATVIGSTVSAVLFVVLFLKKEQRVNFDTLSGARFKPDLFKRLLRYGAPNGVQFMLDIMAFTMFIALIGRIDKTSLMASNIAFQINSLGFMPMIGFSIALTVLVGQALGKNDPKLAQRSTWSAFYLTSVYMTLIALGFWFVPELFLYPFSVKADPLEFKKIADLSKTLLCFVAFYSLFDTGNLVFSGALKGAGDTRFVMIISMTLSWIIMVVPSSLAIIYQWGSQGGLYVAWFFAAAFISSLAVVFFLRFQQGKWKSMRVIEAAPVVPHALPEIPTAEVDSP